MREGKHVDKLITVSGSAESKTGLQIEMLKCAIKTSRIIQDNSLNELKDEHELDTGSVFIVNVARL